MTKLLEIRVRPLLTYGMLCSGPNGIVILISEGSSKREAAKTIWHEIVHVIKSAVPGDQNEDEVEAIAERLTTACPDVLSWCGVEDKFK